MEIGYEVDLILKFQAATTYNSKDVVDVSLVELRYKAGVLACDLFLDIAHK